MQRQGGFVSLAEQAASLPWWAALLLAVLSYLGCHALAGMPVAASEQPTAAVYIQTLAVALQYLLPLLFVTLAALSAYGRGLKRRKPSSQPASRDDASPSVRARPRTRAGTASYMACPKCGSMMVRRKHEEGPDAGKAYLGCSRFPLCKETVEFTG